jgi:L-threonylcarbamoyladenylate synthase
MPFGFHRTIEEDTRKSGLSGRDRTLVQSPENHNIFLNAPTDREAQDRTESRPTLDAQRQMFRDAARHLCRGDVVAVPASSGTALVASACAPEALAKLQPLASDTSPLTAILTSTEQLQGWLPDLDQRGRRLCRRCWPGDVIIRFTQGVGDGLLRQFPEPARKALASEGKLTLQVPPPSQLARLAQMMQMPLAVLVVHETADAVRDLPALELSRTTRDEAPQPPARLEWDGSQVKVLDVGSFQPEQLGGGLTDLVILFVCSGNTCRSPLAEAMCRALLAEQLGCKADELPARGIHVMSAGLGAGTGSPAAAEAVSAAQAYGADLARHASQPLSLALLQDADYIFAMTGQHLRTLLGRVPPGTTLESLSPEGVDVQDPFGTDQASYNACAVEIHQHLHAHMPRLLAEALAGGASPPASPSAGGES